MNSFSSVGTIIRWHQVNFHLAKTRIWKFPVFTDNIKKEHCPAEVVNKLGRWNKSLINIKDERFDEWIIKPPPYSVFDACNGIQVHIPVYRAYTGEFVYRYTRFYLCLDWDAIHHSSVHFSIPYLLTLISPADLMYTIRFNGGMLGTWGREKP